MFKDMNSIWDASKPPSLEKKSEQGFFEQTLPEIKEEPESEQKPSALEEEKTSKSDFDATPAEKHVHVDAEVRQL